MHNTPTILVIEDELGIRRFLKTAITQQAYNFVESINAKDGLQKVLENKPDIILLDLGLPDMDGLEVIKKLRAWTSTPIIILSARDQESDKVKALDLGADDYLTKPFNISELLARLRVALRHGERISEIETPIFESGDLRVDLINRHVWIKEKLIALSPTQYAILKTLIRKNNRIITHKQLLKEIWGDNHSEDIEYLRIYIHQLRQKIEENPAHPKYILTELGIGYRLICQSDFKLSSF